MSDYSLPVITISQQLLSDAFGQTFYEESSVEGMKEKLSEMVVYLLLHEMDKLLQILYRIDVDEKKVKAAFALSVPAQIAPQLATLIIQRIIQKAETRIRFSG